MLKNIWWLKFVLTGGLLVLIVMCALTSYAYDSEEKREVIVYSADENLLEAFMTDPSIEVLNTKNSAIVLYSKSQYKEEYIRKEIIVGGSAQIETYRDGWFARIGKIPVYDSLLDFVGDVQEVSSFLKENGIECEIDHVVVMDWQLPEAFDMPVTAWIKSGDENYFITIDKTIDLNNSNNKEYLYKLYLHSEYMEKFALKDGILQVNGKDISEGNYIKFRNNGVYLPLRATMEALGASVDWDPVTNSVFLDCNNKKYIFETSNGLSLTEEGQPWNLLLPVPGSMGKYSYRMINDRIVMDNNTMQVFVSLIGGEINIDNDNLSVVITQK